MKKMTKAIIAAILAAILAFTAMPFTALADGQSELETAIGRYDAMCTALAGDDGYANLKTNLSDAYTAYINALRVLNNVDENGETVYSSDTDMRNAATALNSAIDNCQTFVEYDADTVPYMGSTQLTANADKPYYNNIIYAQHDVQNDDTSLEEAGDFSNTNTNGWTYWTYYPNVVLLDNGKEDDRPVLPVILGMYSTNSYYTYHFYESIDNFDLVYDHWYGEYNTTPGTTSASTCLTGNDYSDDLFWNPYNDETLRADGDKAVVTVSPTSSSTIAFTEEVYRPAFASVKNALRYYRPSGHDDTLTSFSSTKWNFENGTSTRAMSSSATVYGHSYEHSASTIYVINYEKLITALKTSLKKYSDTGYFSREFIEETILEGGGTITEVLMPLFEALDAATSLNPSDTTKYTYSTNIANAANTLKTDIDNAIELLETAKPDNVTASIANLKRTIRAYEAKMNAIKNDGTVLTNMKPAYDAYVTACKYANAYDYGLAALEDVLRTAEGTSFQSVTHSVDAIAKTLDRATDAMEPMVYGNYNAYADEAFQQDTVSTPKSQWYIDSYRNLVWAGKAPQREVSGSSYKDSTAPGLLRLNQEYNTSNLYVPRAVAVYDNDDQRFNLDGTSSTSGAYIASVPIMMGYMNESGTGRKLHCYTIYSEYATDNQGAVTNATAAQIEKMMGTEVRLEGKWKTGTDANGNERIQQMLSLANISENSDDYGMVDRINNELVQLLIRTSSNSMLRNNGKTDGGVWDRQSTSSNYTNDQQNYFSPAANSTVDAVNNYYYYANRLYINLPDFNSNTGIDKYYHEVVALWAGMAGTAESTPGSRTAGVTGKYGASTGGTWSFATGDRVTSIIRPSLVVINYKPVHERIEKGKSVLTDSSFDISDYSEGGLDTYLYNMTQLTDVDPANTEKYSYNNGLVATYNSDGTLKSFTSFNSQTEAYECAEDIYNLLDKEDTKVSIPDSTDAATILSATGAKEDILTITNDDLPAGAEEDSNYYYELMDELGSIEEIRAQYDLTCLDDTEGIYDEYDAAVSAAQTAMAQVAVNGYNKTQAEITALIEAIESAASDLQSETTTAPRNQHAARYKERVAGNSDMAIFECARNTAHTNLDHESGDGEHNLADMSVYDPLQIAVDTVDYERYNNDNIIKNAEADYDRMTDDTVARRTVGTDGEKPQDMVDDAIASMLTAINVANTAEDDYKYTTKYDVTFKRQVGDNGTATTVSENTDVKYGTTQNFTATGGTVYKWVIQTLDDSGNVLTTSTRLMDPDVEYTSETVVDEVTGEETVINTPLTNSFSLQVQAKTMVTAYILPTVTNGKTLVKVNNPYNKIGYAYLLDSNTAITATESSQTTDGKTTYTASQIVLGDVTIKPTDAAITLSTYTNNAFSLNESVNEKQLNEVATQGLWTLRLNATKIGATTCNVTYNGITTSHQTETELVELTSTADNFVAIAVKSGDRYTPVSYNQTLKFYSNTDIELVDITLENGMYYAGTGENKVNISGDEYFYYALRDASKYLPFVYSTISKLSSNGDKGNYIVYSLYANTDTINNGVVKIVEKGAVLTRTAGDFGIGDTGAVKLLAPKSVNDQFSNSFTTKDDTPFYARGYVKYQYTFNNGKTGEDYEEGQIEAVVYSDIVSSENA